MSRLSATNLAAHHHLNCDLYLHNVYHRRGRTLEAQDPSELAKANFERGLDWEKSCLLPFLDRENLLLTIPPSPVDSDVLTANIEADDREHFFIAGVAFWPPPELRQRFLEAGTVPVNFGLAKPDLLEITRTHRGITWKVVDAKASKIVKTSHHVQIYFYTLCLSYLLPQPYFQPAGSAAIWLPPADGFDSASLPSLDDLKSINTSLLAPSLDDFLFRRLPRILSLPRDSVDWHLNPLCRGCTFNSDCTKRTIANGELGNMPNVSLADVKTLRTLLGISRGISGVNPTDTDIEDLHRLVADGGRLAKIDESFPSTLKKAKRILALSTRRRSVFPLDSPILKSARTKTIQVIPRRNYTCPRREDNAVVLSLITDSSSSKKEIAAFCISVFSSIPSFQPEPVHGSEPDLIPILTSILRRILALNAAVQPTPRTQFYVFSAVEQATLQAHLIDQALTSTSISSQDLRLCIGALAQGASLLQTTYQPLLLSGALLDFMAKGQRSKAELQTCLERMELPTSGSPDQLRQRIQGEICRLQAEGGRSAGDDDRRTELGQLPRVVVLKKELESLIALPIPGYWDLSECAFTLLPASSLDRKCPSDEDIFDTYRNSGSPAALEDALVQRNSSIYALLRNMRMRISSSSLLVNDARILSANFMDLCKEENLRKLFFMQQFEVLAKLSELWKSRIQGCPDAPVLEYTETVQGAKGVEHTFHLISGTLDMPAGEKDKAFYDYIMTEDESNQDEAIDIPVEALYDDLSVSGLLFPLNRYTKAKWAAQLPAVQRKLWVADLRDIVVDGQKTKVTIQTWGGWDIKLKAKHHYRLSPRLVDFNLTKILSTLLELDMRAASPDHSADVPFLQLILNPRSFGDNPDFIEAGKEFVKVENNIQSMFRTLRDLDNLGNAAGALVLKPSQHRAVQRILSSRLSVLWGPPVSDPII
ncbi:hypothetical protein B0H10DRAFT_2159817 [Mycena sp. CBHHK59/15]|nr:hypothetical protein B0H10DRAFT_2159817 [Mycena sp. CBHHK59/15]